MFFREGIEVAELVPAKEANIECPQVREYYIHCILYLYVFIETLF